MISKDRGALICDLAETYGIYDYRSLPVSTVATLSAGLREDSRIKTKIRGGKAEFDTDVLIGLVYDRLVDILFRIGAYKKHPDSLALKLMGVEEGRTKKDIRTFSSADAFEKARNRILQKGS
ncbi:MAG: hypothetical protein IJY32_03895 [Mogibacterium sp.]|nr:hypothetical protein [Mogibacterium sp.]